MKKVAKVKRPRAVDVPDDPLYAPLKRDLGRLALTFHALIEGLQVADAVEEVVQVLDSVRASVSSRLNDASFLTLQCAQANLLMTQAAPWAKEASSQDAAYVQSLVFETLRQCGILLQPIMPGKAALLLDSLDVPATERTLTDAAFARRDVGDVRQGVRLFDVDLSKM